MNLGRTLYERWTGWTPVLLLAALAALTFWLNAQVEPVEPRHDGEKRHDPDLFITNFRAISYDRNGGVRQSLEAQKAQHYPDDESVDFVQPALVVTHPERPTLRVRALTGSISGDRETVLFRGDVHAVREPLPAKPGETQEGPLNLTTDFLRVLPNRGLADTDRPVTIEEARGIIHGVGLVLDNEARTLKIKSNVRGTLLPGPTK
jgi:lipopolysaccharide export system protein LptC